MIDPLIRIPRTAKNPGRQHAHGDPTTPQPIRLLKRDPEQRTGPVLRVLTIRRTAQRSLVRADARTPVRLVQSLQRLSIVDQLGACFSTDPIRLQ